MQYKRILLKLSGEALGLDGWLFDHQKIQSVAAVLRQVAQSNVELGIVIGGGNLWRGRQGGARGMDAVTADMMGMIGTVMNCLVMKDALEQCGQPATVFSALEMSGICPRYHRDTADRAMRNGDVALFGGGIGNPFFTTDTAVVMRAIELKAEALLLAKNIDGVYTADPHKDNNAKLISRISYSEAIKQNLQVMDLTAFALCENQKLPIVRVFGLDDPNNIMRVLEGEMMGTILHP